MTTDLLARDLAAMARYRDTIVALTKATTANKPVAAADNQSHHNHSGPSRLSAPDTGREGPQPPTNRRP